MFCIFTGSSKIQVLEVEFKFIREVGHHILQTYVPSFLVVALSWFSFYLGLDAIPGRVTLLVTSMLTLTTLFTGLQEGLPPVAYIKVKITFLFFSTFLSKGN